MPFTKKRKTQREKNKNDNEKKGKKYSTSFLRYSKRWMDLHRQRRMMNFERKKKSLKHKIIISKYLDAIDDHLDH